MRPAWRCGTACYRDVRRVPREMLPLLREDRPSAIRRAAAAGESPLRRRRVPLFEQVRVVVRQLLARRDVANRLGPDPAVLDHGVAIRVARVIDEPCVVAVDRGVDHYVVVDREEERVMAFARHVGIARVGFSRCEPFAGVLDEARALWNAARREGAQSLHRRRPNLERRPAAAAHGGVRRDSTSVTPPEMMNAITCAASASMRCTRLAGTTRMCPASPYDCGMYTDTRSEEHTSELQSLAYLV